MGTWYYPDSFVMYLLFYTSFPNKGIYDNDNHLKEYNLFTQISMTINHTVYMMRE